MRCSDVTPLRRLGRASHHPRLRLLRPRQASREQQRHHSDHKPIDETIGLDGKQLILKRKNEGLQPEAPQPIVAAIAALRQRPGHMYYFELDNGQLWESTDAEPHLFLGPHETVRIKPGVLGAFFLKTQAGLSIRVHRVR